MPGFVFSGIIKFFFRSHFSCLNSINTNEISHMKKPILLFFVSVLCFMQLSFAQNTTNKEFLLEFAKVKEQEWKSMQKRAEAYAKSMQIELRTELEDGTIIQLIDFVEGQAVYYITDNLGAAITTRANQLWEGGNAGLSLSGQGYDKIGEWDGGAVRRTHQEFTDQGASRVIQVDNASTQSAHATHVAGTLVGAGIVAGAKGMAFAGTLQAHDWNNAESEMATAAANGLEISNHSYGLIRGWRQGSSGWDWYGTPDVSPVEDYLFGFYSSRSRDWDIIAFNAPNYLITKSAGNDRGDGPSNAGQDGNPEKDGGADGYDCIGDGGTAKNVLTVGAVNEVLNYNGPSSVVMSSFSGWGPADDGRVKPDVVAKGVDLYSPVSTNNTSYSSYSGTSMSSPNTAGTMALLQQHYQNTHNGNPMRASTLKGLVIHTADEAGVTTGPDYKFGWGLVNAEAAANLISDDNLMQNVIDEITLDEGIAYTREVTVGGEQPFVATICWTDPAGTIPAASLNPRTPVITNDLDIRIIDEEGNSYYPYKLDPENPTTAATTNSKNFVDNVEKIFISDPIPGNYTIVVDHEGPLTNGLQVFSLILTGIDEYTGLPLCSDELVSPPDASTNNLINQLISWSPAGFATSYNVYFGTDGEGMETPTNLLNGINQQDTFFEYLLEPETVYYLQVIPENNQGENTECSVIWSFGTMAAINQYPYFVDVEDADLPELPQYWQSFNYSQAKWVSTGLIGYSGMNALACYHTSGLIPLKLNNWLISPPMQVATGKEYRISFYYRNFLPGTAESISVFWGNAPDTASMTNKVFEMNDFSDDNWIPGEFLFVPEEDGYGFFSWKAQTSFGYGMIIDDIMMEDWGIVSLGELHSGNTFITVLNKQLWVKNLNPDLQYDLRVINSSGQMLMSKSISALEAYTSSIALPSGVYFVQLVAGGKHNSQKIIIK